MRATERITITLPIELLAHVARLEKNRSRFIAEAVAQEIARRRRREFLRSLARPHPEAGRTAEEGLSTWRASMPAEDSDLVDPAGGIPVQWQPDNGWEIQEK